MLRIITLSALVAAAHGACNPGGNFDEVTGDVCAVEKGRRGRSGPQITTAGGDVVIAVEGGKNVGYKIGDETIFFADLPSEWEGHTDRMLEALNFGYAQGIRSAEGLSTTSDLLDYIKDDLEGKLTTTQAKIEADVDARIKAKLANKRPEWVTATNLGSMDTNGNGKNTFAEWPAGSDAGSLHATDPEDAGDLTYELTAGVLPSGLSVSSAGKLSGKVALQAATPFHFTVQARDVAGDTSDRLFRFVLKNGMTDSCDGLVGKQACAQDKAECKLGVCANGSECKEKANGFTCTCKKGGPWEGDRCDDDVNECEGDESVCEKDANCVNTNGGYRCKPLCETLEENPCKNKGKCVGGDEKTFTCECPKGFGGDTCEIKSDGSKGSPFLGDLKARQLLTKDEVKIGSKNGVFWFQPEKEDAPTQSFIDMEFDDGDSVGGWVLAGYGHITPQSGSTFNIPNLNFPNGYNWKPNDRAGSHGSLSFPKGAGNTANQATWMLIGMTTGGKKVNRGGIDAYDWVFKANIAESTPTCVRTFENHNAFHGASGKCGNMIGGQAAHSVKKMKVAKYEVITVKSPNGERDGEKSTRYNLCESLGVTWSDSYQTSYGWQPDNSHIQRSQYGPMVPTLSGDGNGGCNNNNHGYGNLRGCTKAWLPDQRHASSCYTWMGYWTHINKNNYGATSIWFK